METRRQSLITSFTAINSQVNLSSIRDSQGIYVKHILDSLELGKVREIAKGSRVCDIGTGGWFPLLPLAMSNPEATFVGIDARRKKVDAVNQMIQELDIKNAKAIRTRMEDYHETFDIITARAVAYIDKIIARSTHLLRKGGYFVLYKQVSDEEKKAILQLCRLKKFAVVKEHAYSLFEGDIQRVIYVLQKIS